MSHNRLCKETSPYLLQHQANPVHWWPWGEEALNEAKRLDKPILLSVGYAACHWCHVMAHESFEDAATAEVMNELYVNIKVDREERPDVDAIYMAALHSLGEQGGWPLTMFLTAGGEPFWGGTYFPKDARFGRPEFKHVLREISRIYQNERDKVKTNTTAIVESLREQRSADDAPPLSEDILADAVPRLAGIVDETYGGVQGAPKFPQFGFFWFLWRAGIRFDQDQARDAVVRTLDGICRGGINDHLGGGFARYSVDERWLVPHFEKMLYDNALLMELMTEVWRETQGPLFAQRVAETVEWLQREMMTESGEGAFAASLDADSEGEEGKYYVWTADEIERVLGKSDFAPFAAAYDVTPDGNWEGKTVLNQLRATAPNEPGERERLAEMRDKLWRARENRIRPGWDDKVLADWNGLMIAALARAGQIFGRADWIALARQAFGFICDRLTVDGRLMHSFRNGRVNAPATASDYANMIWAAIRLHEAGDVAAIDENSYLEQALEWLGVLDRHYWMAEQGGYAFTADDTPGLIVRTRTASDDATPNANSVMVTNLVHLHLLTGEIKFLTRAEETVNAFRADFAHNLVAHAGLLAAAIDQFAPQHIVIVSGNDSEGAVGLQKALNDVSAPGALQQLVADTTHVPQASPLSGKSAVDGKAAAYVCSGPQCSLAVTTPADLRQLIEENRKRTARS